jgi:hypothetical protein
MPKIRTAFVAATITALAIAAPVVTAQRGPVDTGPGTLAAARKYLEGRWRLLTYDVRLPGKPPVILKNEGTLTYDAFGNLTIEIYVDPETAKTLAEGGIHTTKGVLITSGKTAINMQARTLTFLIEGQPKLGAPSGPFALNRPRHWQVDGNVLTLTTRGDDGQPASIGRWEKVP